MNVNMESREQEVREALAKRLEFFQQNGANAYPSSTKATARLAELSKKKVGTKVVAAGRLVGLRSMGKSAFGHLEDATESCRFFLQRMSLAKNIQR